MKVSEITTSILANYIRLDNPDGNALNELQVLLEIAKSYIKSYTGIKDISVIGEKIGTGDGVKTEFYLKNTNIIPDSQNIYVNGIKQTVSTDYIIDGVTGKVNLLTAPPVNATLTSDYNLGLDAYNDFVIAVYVLVQDMYDNRCMYVDKANLNRIVVSTLDMHCTNLL